MGACDYTCQALYYSYTCIIAKEAIITMYQRKQRKLGQISFSILNNYQIQYDAKKSPKNPLNQKVLLYINILQYNQ